MFTKSRRRARDNYHRSLWPLYALRSMAGWAAILGAGYGAILSTSPRHSLGMVLTTAVLAAATVFGLGLIPALAVSAIDALIHSRRRVATRSVGAASGRQSVGEWAVAGGIVAAAVGAGYGVVYLNAFDPTIGLSSAVGAGLTIGAATGVAAGAASATESNLLQRAFPQPEFSGRIKRGAVLWATNIAGLAAFWYFWLQPTLELTLIPAGLVATIGAGVVPQLVTTPPVAVASTPPPRAPLPTAPSPGPTSPEGGSGEGAPGDWRTAPPPKTPRRIRSSSPFRQTAAANVARPRAIETDSVAERILNG